VAVADLNHDGKPDLVTVNQSSNSVTVLLGAGDGTFTVFTNYTVGINPLFVAVADFNHDANPDILTANYNGHSVSLLLGNGDGTFAAATNFDVGDRPCSIAIGDFNNDGNLDLAVANNSVHTVSILLGNGNGAFGVRTTISIAGFALGSVVTGDFNGDGKLDLATASGGGGAVSILLGNGDGTFGPPTGYPATFSTGAAVNLQAVAIGDFTGDGKLDLVTANFVDQSCTLLAGNGDGTFRCLTTNRVDRGPWIVAAGDFNGDGKLDLVTANAYSPCNVSLRLGNGDGTFASSQCFSSGTGSGFVAVADLDGDGRSDIVTANSPGISVWLNQSLPALQVCQPPGAARFSWPCWAGWQLEASTNLVQTNGWRVVTNAAVVIDNQNVLTNTLGQGSLFYRLHKL
jgi:hypothetical protein